MEVCLLGTPFAHITQFLFDLCLWFLSLDGTSLAFLSVATPREPALHARGERIPTSLPPEALPSNKLAPCTVNIVGHIGPGFPSVVICAQAQAQLVGGVFATSRPVEMFRRAASVAVYILWVFAFLVDGKACAERSVRHIRHIFSRAVNVARCPGPTFQPPIFPDD